jgi:hypothetical protein
LKRGQLRPELWSNRGLPIVGRAERRNLWGQFPPVDLPFYVLIVVDVDPVDSSGNLGTDLNDVTIDKCVIRRLFGLRLGKKVETANSHEDDQSYPEYQRD